MRTNHAVCVVTELGAAPGNVRNLGLFLIWLDHAIMVVKNTLQSGQHFPE
jgi:hypothetical protein